MLRSLLTTLHSSHLEANPLMSRTISLILQWRLLVVIGGACVLAGCANMVETRAITAFSKAIQEQDAAKVKDVASDRFEQKALRLSESIDDFAVLRLPKGEITIVNTEDVSPNEKRVTVEVGEKKQRIKYRLLREAESGKWVVDDVHIRQTKGNLVSTKSVSELMDLITTVREFLTAWDSGVTSNMTALSTPELGQILKDLPREYVAKLAQQTMGDRANEVKIRPEAQIDDDAAVVRLPRKSGQMLISFRKTDGQWLIHDIAVESRGDQEQHPSIPSVRQLATALRSVATFLNAYQVSDKEKLKTVCRPTFFTGCIEPSDLSIVKLLSAEQAAVADYQIKLESGLVDFVVTGPEDVIKLSLVRVDGEDSQAPIQYLIDEVSLYDLADKQEKRLSAMFMSHGLTEVFAEALSQRKLDLLLLLSSSDFKRRVWSRIDERALMQLPMQEVEAAQPHVLSTVFMGAVTEITVRQGSRAVTYVMHDRGGKLYVDDVMLPTVGRPNSLKLTLDVMISAQKFATALAEQNLKGLQRSSSKELNRSVWHVAEHVPSLGLNLLQNIGMPLITMEVDDEKAVVGLGDDRFGAKLLMVKEGEQFVVDDVLLISGLEAKQRVAMRDAMRLELSRFRGKSRTSSKPTAEETSEPIAPATGE